MIETTYKTISNGNEYSCGDIGISVEEWCTLLDNPKAIPYIDTLLCFLREPHHLATCTTVAQNNGDSAQHYLGKINGFSKWVQTSLGRFKIIDADGNELYWLIPMQRGYAQKYGFEWQLRDELVEALRIVLMRRLISAYAEREPFNGYEELYKWELLAKTSDKSELDIVRATKGQNIIDNERVDGVFKTLLADKPAELEKCVSHLFDEANNLSDRLASFKLEMRNICPKEWNQCANDERTAAALLTCHNPELYTFYKDEIYQVICQYFGYDTQKAGHKYVHFLEIISSFAEKYGQEVQSLMSEQLKSVSIKPDNLAIQTLFWCMRDKLRKSTEARGTAYWMAGFTLGSEDKRDEFFADGIWKGIGTDAINKAILSVRVDDVIILKSSYTKGEDHKVSALKITAVGKVISKAAKDGDNYSMRVEWVSKKEKEFTHFDGAYRQTIHRVTDDTFINFAKEQLNMTTPSKYQSYIDLLIESKNLVLTGAPGTGKTFMAQAIAADMGCTKDEMCFVQFHPSYDYTDFVEGLRPVDNGNGQIGFERKDGVFKEFCKKAVKNFEDSKKSEIELNAEISLKEKYDEVINQIENGEINDFKLKTNGKTMEVVKVSDYNNIILRTPDTTSDRTYTVSFDRIAKLAKVFTDIASLDAITNINDAIRNTIGGCNASSYWSVLKEVYKQGNTNKSDISSSIEKRNYVFIIDEINRGEASKIFGELFYAIDPGYRGKIDVRVKTQYQNLVPESDAFANGFYIPDNVYILATMNDIDRSVESMDFAMRRRFTWKEVKPDDTQDMLDTLDDNIAGEAKERMKRLNDAISVEDGLGPAYMIGPSYFLKLKDNGGDFSKLWEMNLEPLLREYLRGFRKVDDKIKEFKAKYINKIEEDNTTNVS